MPPISPIVSVIIPAFNEESLLQRVIGAVRAGSYPKEQYEIIVVDNGSSDQTSEIAKELGTEVIRTEGVTISAARNLGVKASKGEVLAFLDADCLADANWLEAGVNSLSIEPCVTGSTYDIPQDAAWAEKVWFSQKASGRSETSHINAGNLFVSKELFTKLGGFDEQLVTGEDTEFCLRAAKHVKLISDDAIRVVHLGNPKTLKQFLRREIWYGLGAFGTFDVNKFDKPLIGTVIFALLTGAQILSLFWWLTTKCYCPLLANSALLLLLLAATVFHRRKFISTPVQAVQLGLLYYLFYLGRTISLVMLLLGRKGFYHNIKTKKGSDPLLRN